MSSASNLNGSGWIPPLASDCEALFPPSPGVESEYANLIIDDFENRDFSPQLGKILSDVTTCHLDIHYFRTELDDSSKHLAKLLCLSQKEPIWAYRSKPLTASSVRSVHFDPVANAIEHLNMWLLSFVRSTHELYPYVQKWLNAHHTFGATRQKRVSDAQNGLTFASSTVLNSDDKARVEENNSLKATCNASGSSYSTAFPAGDVVSLGLFCLPIESEKGSGLFDRTDSLQLNQFYLHPEHRLVPSELTLRRFPINLEALFYFLTDVVCTVGSTSISALTKWVEKQLTAYSNSAAFAIEDKLFPSNHLDRTLINDGTHATLHFPKCIYKPFKIIGGERVLPYQLFIPSSSSSSPSSTNIYSNHPSSLAKFYETTSPYPRRVGTPGARAADLTDPTEILQVLPISALMSAVTKVFHAMIGPTVNTLHLYVDSREAPMFRVSSFSFVIEMVFTHIFRIDPRYSVSSLEAPNVVFLSSIFSQFPWNNLLSTVFLPPLLVFVTAALVHGRCFQKGIDNSLIFAHLLSLINLYNELHQNVSPYVHHAERQFELDFKGADSNCLPWVDSLHASASLVKDYPQFGPPIPQRLQEIIPLVVGKLLDYWLSHSQFEFDHPLRLDFKQPASKAVVRDRPYYPTHYFHERHLRDPVFIGPEQDLQTVAQFEKDRDGDVPTQYLGGNNEAAVQTYFHPSSPQAYLTKLKSHSSAVREYGVANTCQLSYLSPGYEIQDSSTAYFQYITNLYNRYSIDRTQLCAEHGCEAMLELSPAINQPGYTTATIYCNGSTPLDFCWQDQQAVPPSSLTVDYKGDNTLPLTHYSGYLEFIDEIMALCSNYHSTPERFKEHEKQADYFELYWTYILRCITLTELLPMDLKWTLTRRIHDYFVTPYFSGPRLPYFESFVSLLSNTQLTVGYPEAFDPRHKPDANPLLFTSPTAIHIGTYTTDQQHILNLSHPSYKSSTFQSENEAAMTRITKFWSILASGFTEPVKKLLFGKLVTQTDMVDINDSKDIDAFYGANNHVDVLDEFEDLCTFTTSIVSELTMRLPSPESTGIIWMIFTYINRRLMDIAQTIYTACVLGDVKKVPTTHAVKVAKGTIKEIPFSAFVGDSIIPHWKQWIQLHSSPAVHQFYTAALVWGYAVAPTEIIRAIYLAVQSNDYLHAAFCGASPHYTRAITGSDRLVTTLSHLTTQLTTTEALSQAIASLLSSVTRQSKTALFIRHKPNTYQFLETSSQKVISGALPNTLEYPYSVGLPSHPDTIAYHSTHRVQYYPALLDGPHILTQPDDTWFIQSTPDIPRLNQTALVKPSKTAADPTSDTLLPLSHAFASTPQWESYASGACTLEHPDVQPIGQKQRINLFTAVLLSVVELIAHPFFQSARLVQSEFVHDEFKNYFALACPTLPDLCAGKTNAGFTLVTGLSDMIRPKPAATKSTTAEPIGATLNLAINDLEPYWSQTPNTPPELLYFVAQRNLVNYCELSHPVVLPHLRFYQYVDHGSTDLHNPNTSRIISMAPPPKPKADRLIDLDQPTPFDIRRHDDIKRFNRDWALSYLYYQLHNDLKQSGGNFDSYYIPLEITPNADQVNAPLFINTSQPCSITHLPQGFTPHMVNPDLLPGVLSSPDEPPRDSYQTAIPQHFAPSASFDPSKGDKTRIPKLASSSATQAILQWGHGWSNHLEELKFEGVFESIRHANDCVRDYFALLHRPFRTDISLALNPLSQRNHLTFHPLQRYLSTCSWYNYPFLSHTPPTPSGAFNSPSTLYTLLTSTVASLQRRFPQSNGMYQELWAGLAKFVMTCEAFPKSPYGEQSLYFTTCQRQLATFRGAAVPLFYHPPTNNHFSTLSCDLNNLLLDRNHPLVSTTLPLGPYIVPPPQFQIPKAVKDPLPAAHADFLNSIHFPFEFTSYPTIYDSANTPDLPIINVTTFEPLPRATTSNFLEDFELFITDANYIPQTWINYNKTQPTQLVFGNNMVFAPSRANFSAPTKRLFFHTFGAIFTAAAKSPSLLATPTPNVIWKALHAKRLCSELGHYVPDQDHFEIYYTFLTLYMVMLCCYFPQLACTYGKYFFQDSIACVQEILDDCDSALVLFTKREPKAITDGLAIPLDTIRVVKYLHQVVCRDRDGYDQTLPDLIRDLPFAKFGWFVDSRHFLTKFEKLLTTTKPVAVPKPISPAKYLYKTNPSNIVTFIPTANTFVHAPAALRYEINSKGEYVACDVAAVATAVAVITAAPEPVQQSPTHFKAKQSTRETAKQPAQTPVKEKEVTNAKEMRKQTQQIPDKAEEPEPKIKPLLIPQFIDQAKAILPSIFAPTCHTRCTTALARFVLTFKRAVTLLCPQPFSKQPFDTTTHAETAAMLKKFPTLSQYTLALTPQSSWRNPLLAVPVTKTLLSHFDDKLINKAPGALSRSLVGALSTAVAATPGFYAHPVDPSIARPQIGARKTLLMAAFVLGAPARIIKSLLEVGANNISATDENGWTAVRWGVERVLQGPERCAQLFGLPAGSLPQCLSLFHDTATKTKELNPTGFCHQHSPRVDVTQSRYGFHIPIVHSMTVTSMLAPSSSSPTQGKSKTAAASLGGQVQVTVVPSTVAETDFEVLLAQLEVVNAFVKVHRGKDFKSLNPAQTACLTAQLNGATANGSADTSVATDLYYVHAITAAHLLPSKALPHLLERLTGGKPAPTYAQVNSLHTTVSSVTSPLLQSGHYRYPMWPEQVTNEMSLLKRAVSAHKAHLDSLATQLETQIATVQDEIAGLNRLTAKSTRQSLDTIVTKDLAIGKSKHVDLSTQLQNLQSELTKLNAVIAHNLTAALPKAPLLRWIFIPLRSRSILFAFAKEREKLILDFYLTPNSTNQAQTVEQLLHSLPFSDSSSTFAFCYQHYAGSTLAPYPNPKLVEPADDFPARHFQPLIEYFSKDSNGAPYNNDECLFVRTMLSNRTALLLSAFRRIVRLETTLMSTLTDLQYLTEKLQSTLAHYVAATHNTINKHATQRKIHLEKDWDPATDPEAIALTTAFAVSNFDNVACSICFDGPRSHICTSCFTLLSCDGCCESIATSYCPVCLTSNLVLRRVHFAPV